MRPARQGDFDGFCGIYSLINALDVAGFSTPRSAVHQRIFVALTDALPNRKLRVAIHRGLKGKDLVRASRVRLASLMIIGRPECSDMEDSSPSNVVSKAIQYFPADVFLIPPSADDIRS